VIAAAVFLDLDVHTWRGVRTFSPDALIAALRGDSRRERAD
jgi:hypothetical protein